MSTNFGNDGILAVCIGSYKWRFFIVVFFLNDDHNFTAIYSVRMGRSKVGFEP